MDDSSPRWTRSPASSLNDDLLDLVADQRFSPSSSSRIRCSRKAFLSTRIVVSGGAVGRVFRELAVEALFPRQRDETFRASPAHVALCRRTSEVLAGAINSTGRGRSWRLLSILPAVDRGRGSASAGERLERIGETGCRRSLTAVLAIWLWDRICVWNGIPKYILPRPGVVADASFRRRAAVFLAAGDVGRSPSCRCFWPWSAAWGWRCCSSRSRNG